jgi:uncharacterized protein YndB with AHSA1/START domain
MKTIHHVVDIEAEPGAAWSAITEESGLASWWSTQVSAPPPAVGAVISFTFRGDFNPEMQITKLVPGAELAWKCVGGHDNWADSTFRFTLERTGERAMRLRFWQEYATELNDDYYGVYNFNWGYFMESLRAYCVTGKGTPSAPG